MVVLPFAIFQLNPQFAHVLERRYQRVIVVGEGDPGLEHLDVPLGIELLDLADQVARLGVAGGLVADRLEVQKYQHRGQYNGDTAERDQAGEAR